MALLDTTFFVDFGGRSGKKRQQEADLAGRKLLATGETLVTSRVNVAELYVGAELSDHPVAINASIEDFLTWITVLELDDRAARQFGNVRAHLQRRGRLIGDMDTLIAAIALANNHSIVTRNTAHFSLIPGLTVISYG